MVPALRTHDFNDGVVVIATGGVDRDARRLVDDDHVVVFVHDADRLGSYGGFMPVKGVGDYVSVLDDGMNRRDMLTVYDDLAALYGVFLKRVSAGRE